MRRKRARASLSQNTQRKEVVLVRSAGLLHSGSFQGRNVHLGRAGALESLSRRGSACLAEPQTHAFWHM